MMMMMMKRLSQTCALAILLALPGLASASAIETLIQHAVNSALMSKQNSADRDFRNTDDVYCTATSCTFTVLDGRGGSATLSYNISEYNYQTDAVSELNTIYVPFTIQFNNYSGYPGISSNGTITVAVTIKNHTSGTLYSAGYTLDGGPVTYDCCGQKFTATFEGFSVNWGFVENKYSGWFEGGLYLNGVYYPASAEIFDLIW